MIEYIFYQTRTLLAVPVILRSGHSVSAPIVDLMYRKNKSRRTHQEALLYYSDLLYLRNALLLILLTHRRIE